MTTLRVHYFRKFVDFDDFSSILTTFLMIFIDFDDFSHDFHGLLTDFGQISGQFGQKTDRGSRGRREIGTVVKNAVTVVKNAVTVVKNAVTAVKNVVTVVSKRGHSGVMTKRHFWS